MPLVIKSLYHLLFLDLEKYDNPNDFLCDLLIINKLILSHEKYSLKYNLIFELINNLIEYYQKNIGENLIYDKDMSFICYYKEYIINNECDDSYIYKKYLNYKQKYLKLKKIY